MSSGKSQAKELEGLLTHEEDPFLNLATVAKAVGKHPSTIRAWIDTGLITAHKIGKLPKIRKSALIKLLAGSDLGEDMDVLERVDSITGDVDDRGPVADIQPPRDPQNPFHRFEATENE